MNFFFANGLLQGGSRYKITKCRAAGLKGENSSGPCGRSRDASTSKDQALETRSEGRTEGEAWGPSPQGPGVFPGVPQQSTQTEQLKQQKAMVSQLWRHEIQDQNVSCVGAF